MATKTRYRLRFLRGPILVQFDLTSVGCEWRLEGNSVHCEKPQYDVVPWPRKDDGFEMRRQFLSIRRGDVEALVAFLNRTGPWTVGPQKSFELHEFWSDQNKIRDLLTLTSPSPRVMPFRVWFRQELQPNLFNLFDYPDPPNIVVLGKKPGLCYFLPETRGTLFASVLLDLASGARFRSCPRSDCPNHRQGTVPFKLMSRHRRRYCSQYCAHLESIRRNRAKTISKKGRKT